MTKASETYSWNLPLATIAKIWRAGCIIRSVFLDDISKAYAASGSVENLMNIEPFTGLLKTNNASLRLIVAEAERTPQISRDFYDAGPRRGTDRLAAFLASLEADGILDLDGDPTSAASHFMGLVQSTTFKGRLCNAIPTLTPDQIAAEADRAVRVFLRAYGHAGGR